MTKLSLYENRPEIEIVSGVCPHDCPDTCAWQVAVERQSGKAIDIWGHPHHPFTQGRLCGKVDRYLERSYHSQRLTVPLKRVGAKGAGQFEEVTWEQALSDIAGKLQEVAKRYGAEAVLPYSYAGTMGFLQGDGMADRFFNRLGASGLAQTICSEAGAEGYKYTIGRSAGLEPQSFAHARLILIWGSNTLTSNMHLWPFIQAARKQGARVIVIDPIRTRTARAADEWLPINPGSDGALALAMMHEIITQDLVDIDYVNNYTLGFEQLADRVIQYTPEWAADVTGIHASRIRHLASDYATAKPAAIRINFGMQRHAGGGMAVRTITCLPALTGAWREYGGGILLSTSGLFPFDTTLLSRPDLREGPPPRQINMNRLGDALSLDAAAIARAHHHPRPADPKPSPHAAGPSVKALIVFNANPAAVTPDQSQVIAGLQRMDLFTVVLEHFQTDTADYADYILPATTQLEHWDIIAPYGHLFLALNRPAIAPLGECLPNSEIFRRLAEAMGYRESCFRESDEDILKSLLAAQTHPSLQGITWDRLLAEGFVRLNLPEPYLPFAEGGFFTPGGKCEFYSDKMAQDGYDPLPTWTPPQVLADRHPTGDALRSHPRSSSSDQGHLSCISPPAHSFLNSTFANLDWALRREKLPRLWIHPQDAGSRRIHDGASVRLSNAFGSVELQAGITEDIVLGTVMAPGVWWAKISPDRKNVNQLTPQNEADMGSGALFYDVKVIVEAIAEL